MNSNEKTRSRSTLVCGIAMWLTCVLAVANAYADDQVRSETVKFADLNLGAPAGVAALYGRIHSAASRVCDQPGGRMAAIRACVTKAESEAIEKVNQPLLTAYYQKKTGNHAPALIASR